MCGSTSLADALLSAIIASSSSGDLVVDLDAVGSVECQCHVHNASAENPKYVVESGGEFMGRRRTRDLHLDLREAITPGARGARELLLVPFATPSLRSAGPGHDAPPVPAIGRRLGLARNTVAEAYAELVAEGWLGSRQGAGTWVVDPGGTGARTVHVASGSCHSQPGAGFARRLRISAPPWLAATRRALATAPAEALRMGDPRGRPELRDALAEYLGGRGVCAHHRIGS